MISQGEVGSNKNYGEGANPPLAQGRQGDALVSELHGRYFSQTVKGRVFHAYAPSITVAAGQVSPLAAAAIPILALWNPLNSGKNCAILKHWLETLSGTPGGAILWNYALGQTLSAVANLKPVSGNLSQGVQSVAQLFSNAAMTGSTAMAALRHAALLPAVATAFAPSVVEEDAGDIIVPPGGLLAFAAIAAGTSHVVQASLTWEEVDIPGI